MALGGGEKEKQLIPYEHAAKSSSEDYYTVLQTEKPLLPAKQRIPIRLIISIAVGVSTSLGSVIACCYNCGRNAKAEIAADVSDEDSEAEVEAEEAANEAEEEAANNEAEMEAEKGGRCSRVLRRRTATYHSSKAESALQL